MRSSLRRIALALALVGMVVAVAGVGSSASADAPRANSANWAGYVQKAAAGQEITAVSGRWIVATAKLLIPSFSATWVGIGGDPSNDLIQAGTASGFFDGYYAWYETLPGSSRPITSGCVGNDKCTVVPGDQIATTITHGTGDGWRIVIENVGKWTWAKDVTYKSTYSSAEWIFEAPTVTVQTIPQGVGVQRFLPDNHFTINGVTQSINAGNPTKSYISPIGILNLATPSAMTAGGAFNVCTYKQRCGPPAS